MHGTLKLSLETQNGPLIELCFINLWYFSYYRGLISDSYLTEGVGTYSLSLSLRTLRPGCKQFKSKYYLNIERG